MSKEVTVWTLIEDIESSGNVLSSVEPIENHPDVRYGMDSDQFGFNTIRDEFNLSNLNEDFDEVDRVFKHVKAFDQMSILGIRTPTSLINLGINGDFQEITKVDDKTLMIETLRFEESKGYICRLLSKLNKEIVEITPELKRDKVIRDAKIAEKIRRERRIKDVPEMPADFWQAIHCLSDYADNYQEFKLLLAPAMDDISDRNLTRLGRSSEILDVDASDLYSNNSCLVTVYRCLPTGEDIEAGDWVSPDYDYALSHSSNVDGAYEVVSAEIPANEIICGADPSEMYYTPVDVWEGKESILDVWKSVTHRKKMNYEPMERVVKRALKKEGFDIKSETGLSR